VVLDVAPLEALLTGVQHRAGRRPGQGAPGVGVLLDAALQPVPGPVPI